MSTTPLPVEVNEALTKAVFEATSPEALRAAVIAEAEKQGVAADAVKTAQAEATRQAAAKAVADGPKVFSRTEVIGGREFVFEAASELELERSVNNALKVAYAVRDDSAPQPVVPQVDPAIAAAAAQKEAEARAASLAKLQLDFRTGSISAEDYIEQSGALDNYLAKKGVPLDALKKTVEQNIEQNENAEFQREWAEATDQFLRTAAGADWPGGQKNLGQIGAQVAALGLLDADDKVAALAQAYKVMKESGRIFPGLAEEEAAAKAAANPAPPVAAAPAVAAPVVAAPAPVTPPAAPKTAATSSSIFGASSGVSSSDAKAAATPGAKIDIPANASPAEIMEAWKNATAATGKNPNEAFFEAFARK